VDCISRLDFWLAWQVVFTQLEGPPHHTLLFLPVHVPSR
jgi:hypothetical protein